MYQNRLLFYGLLIPVGGLMLIDAVPRYTLLHGRLKDLTDPVMDVTGLWQGTWELFAPSPDQVNTRISAKVVWNDRPATDWRQPNWSVMSPWQKVRHFRRMSWYDGLCRSSNSAAWKPFCEHLVRQLTDNNPDELKALVLYQERDVIPPPDKQWRRAYSVPKYGPPQRLYVWSGHE